MVEETCVDPEREPERWTELHDEIGRLPQKYRQAIVLCYLEGLSTEAAASRLGCPQGTILSRLARARAQLGQRAAPQVWRDSRRIAGSAGALP